MDILQHPVYPVPSREQLNSNPDGVSQYLVERNKRIEYEKNDPYRYGYEPEIWKKVDGLWNKGCNEALILGGNRSSKSEYAAKLAVKKLL